MSIYKNVIQVYNYIFQLYIGEIVCGKLPQNRFPSGRIIGGKEALPHQYPWMVKLGSAHNDTCGRCGGTLISNKHVITAGHCVDEDLQKHWKRSHVKTFLNN